MEFYKDYGFFLKEGILMSTDQVEYTPLKLDYIQSDEGGNFKSGTLKLNLTDNVVYCRLGMHNHKAIIFTSVL